MPILYLSEQGAKVSKEGNRLIIRKDDSLLLDISLFKVDTVVILGNVQFSTQAFSDILLKGIDIAFLTLKGRLKGRVESYKSKNVFLKIRQYDVYKNTEKKLQLAKVFVSAKAENCLAFLKGYHYRDKNLLLESEMGEIERKRELIPGKTGIKPLLGTEGYIARVYFSAFRKIVNRKITVMETREQRGSFSYVNQLLSLGYTCAMNEVLGLMNGAGLDPYIGFLHSLDYGRPSLALDMLEEYRQPVIDKFTINIVNRRVIVPDDFEAREQGMRLTKEGIKKYFKHYEKWMTEESRDFQGEKKSFREIIKKQVADFSTALKDGKKYRPYIMKA